MSKPLMERRHFDFLAKATKMILQSDYTDEELLGAHNFAKQLASRLKMTNPNFQYDKYCEAASIKS